ncbi:heat-shock protein Hsp70, partial [Candidatus Saccharibacteria bacterium]|nr:heat-shock protein Hsp70 [Candidatus Saccharibacteria bacterium]
MAGRLLRSAEEGGEKWEVICFPAILEHLTNGDPREPGQALWPWKKDLEALEATKTAVGSRDWLSLYQQKPSPQGSGLFSREWFDIEDEVPKGITSSVRYWDLAATEPKHGTDPDWTVGLLLGRTHLNELYVLDIVRFRKRPKETREIIRKTAELDGRGTWIYIEQEPGSSGEYVTEGFTREVLFEYNVVGDKVSRQTG